MRFIPANFKFSEHVVTLNDVASYYDNSKEAIEKYYDSSVVTPSLVGHSPREVRAKRDKLLRELSIECGMMLMSAVEAAFRSDFVLRCRKSKKEQIDRDFKKVLGRVEELYQVRIKEDLIDRWAEEYPADYMKCIDIAKKEQQADARPEIKETLQSIADYDTIYIGFPNWWGTLPMPMFTQLEQLDFTGKVVKPFVTHEGSGFGSSQNDLNKLCEGAQIKKGLSIPGAKVHDSGDIVKRWVEE